MEPKWTNAIADSTLCNFYKIFFYVFSAWAALILLFAIYFFATTKMSVGALLGIGFNTIISFGLSATSALFLYLICERSLKPADKRAARVQGAQEMNPDMMM
jgi:hypothetical protein